MTEDAALLAAIAAHPDEDTPRLAYADWLDEHRPDAVPSPADGPSARAEYVRAQCRLAGFPYDDPDYPALLEREHELAVWLTAHAPREKLDLPGDLYWFGRSFSSTLEEGWGEFRRGFPEGVNFEAFDDDHGSTVRTL